MQSWLEQLCGTGFMPHGQCYLWTPQLLWLHGVSDSLIALAYFSIPVALIGFVRRRRDVPYPRLFVMFGAFIVACGLTHALEVWTLWHSHYYLTGAVKAGTAAISLATAVALFRIMPAALQLRGPEELQRLNATLEERVRERTAELEAANTALTAEIAERKRAEDEVRLSEARSAAMIGAALDAIVTIDHEGRVVDWNPAAGQLFGHRREDAVGRDMSDLFVPPALREQHRAGLRRVVSGGAPGMLGRRIEMPAIHADGHEFPVELAITRIQEEPPLFTGFIRDLTARKQAEQRQHDLDRKLLEAQKLESLGVLAGGIAHDFNNLLTGVLGNASLARLELPPGSSLQPLLGQIENSSRRAADLCRQLLAYAGRGRFVVQNLDLNQVISETTHLLNLSISKTCVLRLNLATALPAVSADATQVRQIVMNLVLNASEAIGDRSGIIALTTGVARVDEDYRATLLHHDVPCGDYVFLEVGDNGCGMDRATLRRIFDPFFTTKFTGRGLGLAAVLGIMRGHHGALKVYSEPGSGSTFKLFFPAVSLPAEPVHLPPDEANVWRGQGCVLVVDDEETVRAIAARILESAGFTVELASDGREAVEKFRAEPTRYRMVLLDLTMPHLDGEETFRQLRHLRPGVRVVLMSGFNEQEAVGRFVGKGLAGFVQKPFEVGPVLAAIRAALLAG